jgi:hypothetical protein
MNADFAEIIKRIIADQGSDKEVKRALTKAVKMRFTGELKNASEKERPFTKAYLAQKLHDEGHFDLTLCNKTLDTLCTALFDEQVPAALPELAPQPQAVRRLVAQPVSKKVPHRTFGKEIYILAIIILALLGEVLYLALRPKPETPPAQENTIILEVQPKQTNPDGDNNE